LIRSYQVSHVDEVLRDVFGTCVKASQWRIPSSRLKVDKNVMILIFAKLQGQYFPVKPIYLIFKTRKSDSLSSGC